MKKRGILFLDEFSQWFRFVAQVERFWSDPCMHDRTGHCRRAEPRWGPDCGLEHGGVGGRDVGPTMPLEPNEGVATDF